MKYSRKNPIFKTTINNFEIEIPIFLSAFLFEEYINHNQENLDYRNLFLKLSYQIYLNNDNQKEFLSFEEFSLISEKDLIKFLKVLLNEDETLYNIFNGINEANIFKKFYKACQNYNSLNQEEVNKILNNKNIKIQDLSIPNISEISKSLRPITEFSTEIKKALEPISNISQVLSESIQPYVDTLSNISNSFSSFYIDFNQRFKELFPTEIVDDLIIRAGYDILIENGWTSPREIPKDIVRYISQNESILNSDDIDKLIEEYLDKDEYWALDNIIDNWFDLEIFKKRKKLINEIKIIYKGKLYNSSLILLTIQLQGILEDFREYSEIKVKRKVTSICSKIRKELEKNIDYIDNFDYINIINLINSIKENYSHSTKYGKKFEDLPYLARNRIGHGHTYKEGTSIDSLKLILQINELHFIYKTYNQIFKITT